MLLMKNKIFFLRKFFCKNISNSTMSDFVYPIEEIKRFMRDCLISAGASDKHAALHAELLAEADYRGHFSHGMNRLDDLKNNRCNGKVMPTIINETAAIAFVDGNHTLGSVIGDFCMDLAIQKARNCGIGFVTANHGNHYGIAGWYVMKAIKNGFLGFSCTNTSPLMVPTRAKEGALGTNPISFGAPGIDDDHFLLDMATTSVAVGKIEVQQRKQEPIPKGWALDDSGKPTTDANIAFQASKLMPLGGEEINSGYKGYGLGLMVEVLTGIISGSKYGPYIRKWTEPLLDEADLGHCFFAINPEMFAPGFKDRMQDLMCHLRGMESLEKDKPVLVHGDKERENMKKVNEEGGVKYVKNQIETCEQLSKVLNVEMLKPIKK